MLTAPVKITGNRPNLSDRYPAQNDPNKVSYSSTWLRIRTRDISSTKAGHNVSNLFLGLRLREYAKHIRLAQSAVNHRQVQHDHRLFENDFECLH